MQYIAVSQHKRHIYNCAAREGRILAQRKRARAGKKKKKKKKMTQGWVVYGGMRHAEPQREMVPRSYMSKGRKKMEIYGSGIRWGFSMKRVL